MRLTEKLLLEFGPDIKALTLVPSGGGVFEVFIDGELVHSKARTGHFPDDQAIAKLIRARVFG